MVPATREQGNRKLHLMWIKIRLWETTGLQEMSSFLISKGVFLHLVCHFKDRLVCFVKLIEKNICLTSFASFVAWEKQSLVTVNLFGTI